MKIAIMGFGTVGTGVEEILYKKKKDLLKNNFDIKIERILIKNKNKERHPQDKTLIFTDNFEEILNSGVDTVIDVTSNLEETYERIVRLMKAGKNIVTANKAVVSKYFEALNDLAKENKVYFAYEAAVAGAIPIIHPLMEEVFFNDIYEISGILNGTSNYILSKMEREGSSYEDVLKEAQELGYAEADPSADVEGLDAMRKIRILSSLAYRSKIREDEIFCFGINTVKKSDFDFAKENGYTLRILGKSFLSDGKINISVMPRFLRDDFFENTFDGTNAIKVHGENFKSYELKGPGAGKLETADAIMRDLLRILAQREIKTFYKAENSYPVENNLEKKYYLRCQKVSDDLKNLISAEKIVGEDHHLITKNLRLEELIHAIGDLEGIFIAEIEEEI